jgi:hypothetical protein
MELKILQHCKPKSIQLPVALEVGIGRYKAKAMLIFFCLEFGYPMEKSAKAPRSPPSKARKSSQPISTKAAGLTPFV